MRYRGDKSHEPVYLPRTDTDWVPKTVAIDDTAGGTEVLAADKNRLGWCIVNTDAANAVYLGATGVLAAGGGAGALKGFRLAAGQSISSSQADGYAGEIRAICAAGLTAELGVLSW